MKMFDQVSVICGVTNIDDRLRDYGREGYELVAATEGHDKSTRILFFKRPFVDVLEK